MSRRRLISVLTAAVLAGAVTLLAGPPALAAPIPTPDNPVTNDENPRVPAGAAWTEAYFPSSDGSAVQLHADVLRPANLAPDARTPVILSVGPYFAHIGQTGNDGFSGTGPSARFNDLIVGADLMARGYTVVLVDLRGFGGSTGCLDWVGPGEQADVKAAIAWSASQPWSTGKVGLYGKSYDASTGLVGADLQTPGLAAVVAQEPVWNMYNYLYTNGVPRFNRILTPEAYNSIAALPGMPDDSAQYKANAAYEQSNPNCFTDNIANNQDPNPDSAYWRARDLAANAAGSAVPLFVTQGFLEVNTKPEDMQVYLDNHSGPERGWLGPWDHVRGNDVVGGRLAMGRAGWFAEVMRFYDQYLKGVAPTVQDPAFAIQDSLGAWRAQPSWPVSSRTARVPILPGAYQDGVQGGAQLTGPPAGAKWDMENFPARPGPMRRTTGTDTSYFTWTQPLAGDLRLTGTPQVSLNMRGQGNVMVQLWDVAPDGTGVMFAEQVSLVSSGKVEFDVEDVEWTLRAGHQLAVEVGTVETYDHVPSPSFQRITVLSGQLALDLQNPRFDVATQGQRSPWLDQYVSYFSERFTSRADGTVNLTVPQNRP